MNFYHIQIQFGAIIKISNKNYMYDSSFWFEYT